MGDLGVITLFAGDRPTLPLMLYQLMNGYRMADAAACALLLMGSAWGCSGCSTGEADVTLEFRDILLRQDDFTLTADLTVPQGRHAVIGARGRASRPCWPWWRVSGPDKGPADLGRPGYHRHDARPTTGVDPVSTPNLFPHLTVKQNVGWDCARTASGPGSAAPRDAGAGPCRPVRHRGSPPAALSGGQQSRVALARVLLRARPLLLLDEPFAALGPALKSEMLTLLAQVASDTTVLMVTHDPADARAFAPDTCWSRMARCTPPAPPGRCWTIRRRDCAPIWARRSTGG